ncbi:MAG: glycerophosphodiester phosphodiesterase, partial [Candidatus Thorarchaeota archaeon]
MIKNTIIIGHRGASKISPENTLKSFKKAIELRADYIELDLFKSRDNELVITHDPNLKRITGYDRFVEDLTLPELRALDFGEGEKIPTLQEVIDVCKGKIGIIIEVISINMGKSIVQLLQDSKLISTTIISSFNFKELKKIKNLEPRLKYASIIPYEVQAENNPKWLLWKTKKEAVDRAAKNKFLYIHPHFALVDKQLIDYSHQQGLKVNVYVVDV